VQCGNGTAQNPYPNVTLPTNEGANQGIVPFQFTITNDQTGLQLQFANTNPLCVQQGSKPPCPSTDPQIPNPPGGAGSKVLTFVDLNTRPDAHHPQAVVLKYQLNFTDSQGNAVTSIDPDITNGGKSLSYSFINTTALVIGVAVLVVLIVAFVLVRNMRRGPAG
jgi:hypothetical protein